MADEQPEVLTKPGLTKEQKIGFTLLLIFAVITLCLGALQLRNTLYAPFALNNSVPASIKEDVNGVDALRYRDTDHDGLSDFDELYVYHTSPYLYDTFGYGMSDKEVLSKGLALCPGAGKFCSDEIPGTTSTAQTDAGAVANALGQDAVLQNPPTDLTAALRDPKQLRQMLLQAGMDQAVLNKINDADLVVMANELLTSSTVLKQMNSPSN